MNRPPRQNGPRRPKPVHAHFEADDQAFIEAAWAAKEPRFCRVVEHAMAQFLRRIVVMFPDGLPVRRGPLPAQFAAMESQVQEGEHYLWVFDPPTFFDQFVVRLVVQDVCDATGSRVALIRLEHDGTDPSRGRCPDVIFPDYTPRT